MNLRYLFPLLTGLLFHCTVFGQTSPDYEIVYLGRYYKPVSFNPDKNWYLVAMFKDHNEIMNNKIIKIDPQKDLRWFFNERDTTHTLMVSDTAKHVERGIIIGTKDSLKEQTYNLCSNWHHPRVSGVMKIGDQEDVNLQLFRSSSPYVTIHITGEVKMKECTPEVHRYEMLVSCEFDDYAYYTLTSFGGKEFKNTKKFTQSLNTLIKEDLIQKEIKNKAPIQYAYLMYEGFIDKDELVDYIFIINGRHYLFLTYQHDLDNEKIFHIEKSWYDLRDMEF